MSQSMLIMATPDCCEQYLCLGEISIKSTVCRAAGKMIKNPFERTPLRPLKPVEEKK